MIVWSDLEECWFDTITGEYISEKEMSQSSKIRNIPDFLRRVSITETKDSFDPGSINVFVVGATSWEKEVFRRNGYRIVYNIQVADIVCWTGGADLSSSLYGEEPLSQTRGVNLQRDVAELGAFRAAAGKFKVGICRGGQLLNILNGGRLWQHVSNHANGQHSITDLKTGAEIMVSSAHHQAFRPTEAAEIVATCFVSSFKESQFLLWDRQNRPMKTSTPDDPEYRNAVDYEVIWYPESRSLCFQGHPEYENPPSSEAYFFELLKRYYQPSKKELEKSVA